MGDLSTCKRKYVFSWNIESFFSYFVDSEDRLFSPTFTIEPLKASKWHVELAFRNQGLLSDRFISCFLQRILDSTNYGKIKISYYIEFIGSSSKIYVSGIPQSKEFENNERMAVFHCLRVHKETADSEKSSGDNMTIRLTITSNELIETRDSECIARTIIGGYHCSFEWKIEKKLPQFKTFSCFYNLQVAVPNGFFPQQYLSNNLATLLCECHFSNGTLPSELQYIQSDSLPDSAVRPTHEDFHRMYLEHILSDVKLIINNETFYSHKCLLSARSPVFLAMFSGDTVENQTNIVKITDTDSNVFALFIKFLYTGDIDLEDCETAIKVMMCADKYQVESLKEKCSTFLMSSLCEENACKILVVANMVDQKLLKASATRRIKYHASKIFKSSDWLYVIDSRTKLASEVLAQLTSDLAP